MPIAISAQQAGTLNNEFSQDGWDASVYANDEGFSINKTIVQPDGKLLACAEANFSDQGYEALLIRYNTNGTLDTNFGGGDGIVRSIADDVAVNLHSSAAAMALQDDGKILIAGTNFNNSERIFRLNADGTFDLSFGINGVVDVPRPNSECIYHIAVQSDNKIVASGRSRMIINGVVTPHIFLWRFTENGAFDSSFGTGGVVTYNFISMSGLGENYLKNNDLLILPDNKIVVNQTFAGVSGYSVLFKKFNSNGSADLTFGNNGNAARTEFFEGGTSRYSSSSLQQDGSIVFSFTSFEEGTNYSESVFRVSPEGFFDHSLHIELGNYSINPDPIKVLVNGNRIYIYKKENAENSSFAIIHCYDLIGNPIPTFGENGSARINQNNIPTSYQTQASISENGNIYLVSHAEDLTTSDAIMLLVSNVIGFDSNLSIKQDFTPEIVLAPNPTPGQLHISNLDNAVIDKIEIIDMNAKVLSSNTDEVKILDLSTYSSGIYLIRLHSGPSILEKKIVKK